MLKGKLNRDQAIAAAGIETVNAVEKANCDFTNRVDADLDLQGVVEFSASVKFVDASGIQRNLTVYYYPKKSEIDDCDGDLGSVDWDCISGYEID